MLDDCDWRSGGGQGSEDLEGWSGARAGLATEVEAEADICASIVSRPPTSAISSTWSCSRASDRCCLPDQLRCTMNEYGTTRLHPTLSLSPPPAPARPPPEPAISLSPAYISPSRPDNRASFPFLFACLGCLCCLLLIWG